ncbi:MAG: AAA family ATPase [Dehalococcoidia bacterium]|nr:AAA family ATPase [Dehalococcoidia bacterium]
MSTGRKPATPRGIERDCITLEAAIGDLPRRAARPFLLATVGLPGSGKSHFARGLCERLPCVLLESDALRRCLFARPRHGYKESGRLFTAIHALIERYLSDGYGVLLDSTNLREEHRQILKQIADDCGCPLLLVEVRAPEGLVIQRLRGREGLSGEAGIEVYMRMRGDAEPISLWHRSVDTSWDTTAAIEEIAREIEGL